MKPRTLLFLAALCAHGLALAQTQAQQAYAGCLSEARRDYRDCRRDHDHGCVRERREQEQSCWNMFNEINRRDPFAPQRFEPIPIPQRPVYVLPGMR